MKNIIWHDTEIKKEHRESILGQKAILLWFTGLSGSGKSTIATALQKKLIEEGKLTYILDGDNIRHGLNQDLGFSEEHRIENIRRIGEVAKLFVDAGMITMASFISPYKKDRDLVRKKLGEEFIEVYVKCNLADCEKRDPKGLYKKARKGGIPDFTGISAPYEEPVDPEITIETDKKNVKDSVDLIYSYLKEKKII